MNLAKIAELAHESVRAYCQSIGDDSLESWDEAPEWKREFTIDGVKFHLDNPSATPEQSHQNWMNSKMADGWKWGPIKNGRIKEHPCLCPYRDLSYAQQFKGHVFRSVVHAAALLNAKQT